jgi:hypothetical protein
MRWKTIVAAGLGCLLGVAGLALEEEASDRRIRFGLDARAVLTGSLRG